MAFATSNVQKNAFGSLKVTYGDWSGAAGDADGTVTVEGGRVYAALFTDQDSSGGPVQIPAPSVNTTGTYTITMTIPNRQTVTNGRFLIIHA